MYNDIGKKIQDIGATVGWISLIAGAITWLILITNKHDYYGYYITDDDIWGWVALVSGVMGYVSSWFTYGFGQLIDDVHALRSQQAPSSNRVNDELPEL